MFLLLDFYFSQLGMYILKILHNKWDLDYCIWSQKELAKLFPKSQIYILEK